MLDVIGLNDRHIVHVAKKQRGIDVKYDAPYVLSRRPYFICDNFTGLMGKNMNEIMHMSQAEMYHAGAFRIGMQELLTNPQFDQDYHVANDYPGPGTCFETKAR